MKKKNVFGTIDKTAGMNVMRAIEECDQAIGIPPYNYGKMLEVFRSALKPEEVDLLCKGFGIYCPRMKQVDIAAKMKLSDSEVSRMAREAVQKLQGSPYRVQLRSLAPTAEELFATISKLQVEVSNSKELKATKHRLQATAKELASSKEARKQLEADNAQLSYEKEQLAKKLATSQGEYERVSVKVADLLKQVGYERARADAVKKAFDATLEQLNGLIGSAKEELTAAVRNVEVSESLEGLHLPEDVMNALRRASIADVRRLCSMSPHTLTKMVGRKNASLVEAKLSEMGLALRVG